MKRCLPLVPVLLTTFVLLCAAQQDQNKRSSPPAQAQCKFADGKTIRYLNINEKLAKPDGTLIEGMTVDGLHLSLKGYQVWADALKPILTELLGTPAKTDHAPPPTGDPSAR